MCSVTSSLIFLRIPISIQAVVTLAISSCESVGPVIQIHIVLLNFLEVLLQAFSLHFQELLIASWVYPHIVMPGIPQLCFEESNSFLNKVILTPEKLQLCLVIFNPWRFCNLVGWRKHTLKLVGNQLLLDLLEFQLECLILSELGYSILPFAETVRAPFLFRRL